MREIRNLLLTTTFVLAACSESKQISSQGPASTAQPERTVAPVVQRDHASELQALSDELMRRLEDEQPFLKMLAGKRITELPNNSFEAAQRARDQAQAMLRKLHSIDKTQLNHDDQLTYAMLEGQLEHSIEGVDHFWHKFNVTPYAANFTYLNLLPVAITTAPLSGDEDVDILLDLMWDVARYVEADLTRLKAQEDRSIMLPKAAIPGVINTLRGGQAVVSALTTLSKERLAELDEAQKDRLASGMVGIVEGPITDAFDALFTYLGEDYVARAPASVGLGQYPGGAEAYRFAIRQQTTLDLAPEEIHRRGLVYMAELQTEMAEVRRELGFQGTQAEFHDQIRNDPRFYAETPEEVEERYLAYIRRIEPLIDDYFSVTPRAPYGVKRLDPVAERGMTFGYYQAPSPSEPVGNYRYNGSNLESRPMVWTGALIYHELVPGHHFHMALQRENDDFSEFRKLTGVVYAAYTEGWANYAASLAYEMGIMDDLWDRYGWLLFNSFITNRLVVDTGMNAMGWSLEEAREYMMDNTFASEEEVATEILRYSTDIPAQALAYKLGYEKIREIRVAQEQKLGADFDIKKFHEATVGSGAMPLQLLDKHVDWYMEH